MLSPSAKRLRELDEESKGAGRQVRLDLKMSESNLDRLKNSMNRTILPFLLFLCAVPGFALDLAHFNELNHKARGFAQKQDWKSLRLTLIELGAEMPTPTPNYMLRMASVETHLGNKTEALKWMERYAATGLTYDISKDDDLKPLVGDNEYQPIANRMLAQTKTISHAKLACTLPIADLMPEDLTYLAKSKWFVVSSVQHHSLYRVSLPKKAGGDCTLQEIPLDASLKRWPVLAGLSRLHAEPALDDDCRVPRLGGQAR